MEYECFRFFSDFRHDITDKRYSFFKISIEQFFLKFFQIFIAKAKDRLLFRRNRDQIPKGLIRWKEKLCCIRTTASW